MSKTEKGTISVRNRQAVESWEKFKKNFLHETDLKRYILGKCLNGIDIGYRVRGQKDAWITLVAEFAKDKRGLSPLARRVGQYVSREVERAGYPIFYDWDHTDGVAYISIHVLSLGPIPENEVATKKVSQSGNIPRLVKKRNSAGPNGPGVFLFSSEC